MTSTASAKKDSAGGLFARYVSQNILGMLGLSAYVLADTFFISLAQGADGITALNLILPLLQPDLRYRLDDRRRFRHPF